MTHWKVTLSTKWKVKETRRKTHWCMQRWRPKLTIGWMFADPRAVCSSHAIQQPATPSWWYRHTEMATVDAGGSEWNATGVVVSLLSSSGEAAAPLKHTFSSAPAADVFTPTQQGHWVSACTASVLARGIVLFPLHSSSNGAFDFCVEVVSKEMRRCGCCSGTWECAQGEGMLFG